MDIRLGALGPPSLFSEVLVKHAAGVLWPYPQPTIKSALVSLLAGSYHVLFGEYGFLAQDSRTVKLGTNSSMSLQVPRGSI